MEQIDFHEMGITYGPSKREIVNYRNSLLEQLADEEKRVASTPRSARGEVTAAQPEGAIVVSAEADATAQATELMMSAVGDLDIVMEEKTSRPNSPKGRSQNDSPDASVEDQAVFIVGEADQNAANGEAEPARPVKLSASDRFRMYLKARANGKSEQEAVEELVEIAKLYPGSHAFSGETDDGAALGVLGHEEMVADEQDLSIPVARLDNFKRQHVSVTIANKKLFSDSPTSLEEFRLFAEAHGHIITFCVAFGACPSYGNFLQDLLTTIESNLLPISVVDCPWNEIQYFMTLLGPELVSYNKKTQLKLNFIAYYEGNSPDMLSLIKKSMISISLNVAPIVKRMAYLDAVLSNAGEAVDLGDGVLVCYQDEHQKLRNFALGTTIYWFAGGVPKSFQTYCAKIGVSIEEVPTPLELDNLLFFEYSFLFNSHSHIRFVFQANGHRDDIEPWLLRLRDSTATTGNQPNDSKTKELYTPVLLWGEKPRQERVDKSDGIVDLTEGKYRLLGPEQVDYSIYTKFSRVWSTSEMSVLEKFATFDGELTWAPDIRFGCFHQVYDWQGGAVVQDIACCNVGTGRRTYFAILSINNTKRLETGVIKAHTPVWQNLHFETEIFADDEISIEIYEKETIGKAFKGVCKFPVHSLLREASSRNVQFITKLFPLQPKKENLATAGSGGNAQRAQFGLLQITISFLPEANVAHYIKSVYPIMNTLMNSNGFMLDRKFPTHRNLLSNIITKSNVFPSPQLIELNEQVLNTKIFVHSRVLNLMKGFLIFKAKYGTAKEREIYNAMTPEMFAVRLIRKRPLVYFGSEDITTLRDLSKPSPSEWKNVGTDAEGKIKMVDYLTNDEMSISSLLGVATPTYFINDGNRRNGGEKGREGSYEEKGILIGVVGARFEHLDRMESRHMLVTRQHSVPENGYGKTRNLDTPEGRLLTLWSSFYHDELPKNFVNPFVNPQSAREREKIPDVKVTEKYFPAYHEVDGLEEFGGFKFIQLKDGHYFNVTLYKARIRISLEIFVFAAQHYAVNKGKDCRAYCHVVGLGLGVWQLCDEQALYMLDVFNEIFSSYHLPNISDINFSWFPAIVTTMGKVANGQQFTENGNNVTVWFSKRNVSEPLNDSNGPKKLLVAMYAWDGNAFPGNEYWLGGSFVTASGDPAAACCSLVAQTQNPLVNRFFAEHAWIVDPQLFLRGNNTLVVSDALTSTGALDGAFLVSPRQGTMRTGIAGVAKQVKAGQTASSTGDPQKASSTRKITGSTPSTPMAGASGGSGSFSKKTGAKMAKMSKKKSDRELQSKQFNKDENSTASSSTTVRKGGAGYDI